MPFRSSEKIKKLDIKISRNVNNIFLWNYKTAFKWSGIEFADIRKYVPWDSVKHIDWITSAKQWSLYIKKYQEERQLTIFFLVDVGSSMQFGIKDQKKIDTLSEVLYTLAFSWLKNNDKIGAIIYDDQVRDFIQPKKWKAHITKIVWAINKNLKKKESNLSPSDSLKALQLLNSLKYKNSLVFMLTDDNILDHITVSENKVCKISGIKNEIVYINIFDSFENNLADENFQINLHNQLGWINIDLRNKANLEKYRELRKQKIADLKKFLLKNWIDYLQFDETSNIFKELLNYFRFKNKKR